MRYFRSIVLVAIFLSGNAYAIVEVYKGECTFILLDQRRVIGEVIKCGPDFFEINPEGPNLFCRIPRDSVRIVIDAENTIHRLGDKSNHAKTSLKKNRAEFLQMNLECLGFERVDTYVIDETCTLDQGDLIQVYIIFEVKRKKGSRAVEVRNMKGNLLDPKRKEKVELDCGGFSRSALFIPVDQQFLNIDDISLGGRSLDLSLRIISWTPCDDYVYIGHYKKKIKSSIVGTYRVVGEIFH